MNRHRLSAAELKRALTHTFLFQIAANGLGEIADINELDLILTAGHQRDTGPGPDQIHIPADHL